MHISCPLLHRGPTLVALCFAAGVAGALEPSTICLDVVGLRSLWGLDSSYTINAVSTAYGGNSFMNADGGVLRWSASVPDNSSGSMAVDVTWYGGSPPGYAYRHLYGQTYDSRGTDRAVWGQIPSNLTGSVVFENRDNVPLLCEVLDARGNLVTSLVVSAASDAFAANEQTVVLAGQTYASNAIARLTPVTVEGVPTGATVTGGVVWAASTGSASLTAAGGASQAGFLGDLGVSVSSNDPPVSASAVREAAAGAVLSAAAMRRALEGLGVNVLSGGGGSGSSPFSLSDLLQALHDFQYGAGFNEVLDTDEAISEVLGPREMDTQAADEAQYDADAMAVSNEVQGVGAGIDASVSAMSSEIGTALRDAFVPDVFEIPREPVLSYDLPAFMGQALPPIRLDVSGPVWSAGRDWAGWFLYLGAGVAAIRWLVQSNIGGG